MDRKEREKDREKAGLGERRITRATEHVNSFWFPVNKALHEKLRAAVQDGAYENDCVKLVEEIRSDFALFTYCLREVASMLREEGVPIPQKKNALEVLEFAGAKRLTKIVLRETNAISPHSLETMTEVQSVRLEEAMISASASQTFFSELGLDPNTAYSTALLRQLGYALVAWNYSTIYQKAIFSLRPGETLDTSITEKLGFSPAMLAISVMNEWGLSPEVMNVVKGEDYSPGVIDNESLESAAIVKTLGRVCKISESLARANNPQYYPSAVRDWAFAYDEVQTILGKEGLKAIADKLQENTKAYATLMPHIFRGGFILDPEVRLHTEGNVAGYEPNPFVSQCGEPLQGELKTLYRRMSEGRSAQEYIRTLVRQIVPVAGYTRGCVYTIDPPLGMLVPQLAFGNSKLSDYKPVVYTADEDQFEVILSAFQSNRVVVGAVNNDPETPVTCLARSLGYSQRVGVLYLEIPEMIFNVLEGNARTEFNAIAYTLDDCFKIV